ncbi:MAG: bifunctional adenosylcobinamide kinase/adenosylcobinamide-phosphate guanylyltransferase [Alistipes sp.]|jgi:adenosylcobinamide kinase/adenosylcobinamide-phosphate guanylyltransferase|nr:bifunctional adenosylcobinamide kinase/adenosylcobinamide-phosphate guanylyltransferase [Alistipes sp.]
MEKRIILVTGGQSSGKSLHAEGLARGLAPDPVYVATARAEGMEDRVLRHRARRGPEWTTIEEPLRLGALAMHGRVVLVDCVTLWCTNLFFEAGGNIFSAENTARAELERFTAPEAVYVFVTGEVGLGGVSESAMARDFADLLGRVNQFIAAMAHEVTLVVSGIPVKIK